MKKIILLSMKSNLDSNLSHFSLLLFRIALASELIIAHGLKKLGIGVSIAEVVPNPLGLPQNLNQFFAIGANIVMPVFVILGLFTRLSTLPILAVTLTGYFIVHFDDPILVRDMPFMYSISFLLIAIMGAGKYSLDYCFSNK